MEKYEDFIIYLQDLYGKEIVPFEVSNRKSKMLENNLDEICEYIKSKVTQGGKFMPLPYYKGKAYLEKTKKLLQSANDGTLKYTLALYSTEDQLENHEYDNGIGRLII